MHRMIEVLRKPDQAALAGDRYYHGVDLIRFICAIMVAFFHLGFSCWASPTSGASHIWRGSYTMPDLAPFLWFGWVGVEIFFVISGFVVANSAARASPIAFAKGRMLRLYPGAWVCASLTLLVQFLDGFGSVKRYILSILLVPTGPWIDGQYWTLGVEMAFYCLIFVALLMGMFRYLFVFAGVLGVVSSVATIAGAAVYPHLDFIAHGYWRLTLLNYGSAFVIGVLLYAYASGQWRRWMLSLMIVSLGGSTAAIYTRTLGMSERTSRAPFDLIDFWCVPALVFLAGVVGILLSIHFRERIAAFPPAMLSVLRKLGLATYPLYLLHFTIGIVLTRQLVSSGIEPWLAMSLSIFALTMLSVLIAEKPERIIRRWLRMVLDVLDQKMVAPGRIGSLLHRSQPEVIAKPELVRS